MISRRTFLGYGGAVALATFGSNLSAQAEDSFKLVLEENLIPVKNLPNEFQDYRIGFLSDLHLGGFVPHEWIEQAVRMVREAGVDVVVLGGDYISYRDSKRTRQYGLSINTCFDDCPEAALADRLFLEVADLLAPLDAPDGVFAVFGNHDRYVEPKWRYRVFHRRGLGNIENSHVDIVRGDALLRVIGTEDLKHGRPRLPKFPRLKEDREVRVLLSHNPDFLSIVQRRTNFEFDLGLAGHTHGGQIKVPLFGALEYNVADIALADGLCLRDGSAVYTTRGIGMVNLPIRLGCPPEVSILQLTSA